MQCVTVTHIGARAITYKEITMGAWFNTGFTPAKDYLAARQTKADTLYRFWVRIGEERRIIFLDDFSSKIKLDDGRETEILPFNVHEHCLKIDGDWKRPLFVTCTQATGNCECCRRGLRTQFVGALTILDITPTVNKETGEKIVKPWKKLMVAVTDALVTLDSKKNKRGGNLQGCVFSVARHDRRHPRVGSDFEFEEKIDDLKAKYPDLDLAPYGYNVMQTLEWYKKIFTPMKKEDVEKTFATRHVEDGFAKFRPGAAPVEGGGSSETGGDAGESIQY